MQIPLPFPRSDEAGTTPIPFQSGAANMVAVSFAAEWLATCQSGDPSQLGLIINGASGSGKTRLATEISTSLSPKALSGNDVSTLIQSPLNASAYVVDDCEAADPADMMAFINHCFSGKKPFILTGAGQPEKWAEDRSGVALIDLATRLTSLPKATLDRPDLPTLSNVLRAFLAARQIRVSEETAMETASLMRRDFHSAAKLARLLDEALAVDPASIARESMKRLIAADAGLRL